MSIMATILGDVQYSQVMGHLPTPLKVALKDHKIVFSAINYWKVIGRMYPTWWTYKKLLKMTIEIVDFPINSMVDLSIAMLVITRGYPINMVLEVVLEDDFTIGRWLMMIDDVLLVDELWWVCLFSKWPCLGLLGAFGKGFYCVETCRKSMGLKSHATSRVWWMTSTTWNFIAG